MAPAVLTDMSLPIPDLRPAPINAALAEELGDLLRFRHLFRNTYGWELRADPIRRLEGRMPGVQDRGSIARFGTSWTG